MSFERDLCTIETCHVFKIGPRPSAEGYEAAKWYENEIWCGKCRVIEKGENCEIRLEHQRTGKLFAKCKYEKGSVERVIDSSRYFVLRIERGNQHAFIGMGFQERAEAFDFKDALGRFEKYKDQEKVAKELKAIPTKDYSMKEGEKIKVKFRVKTKKKFVENPIGYSDDDDVPQKQKKKKKSKFSLDFAPPPGGAEKGVSRRRRRRGKKKGGENKKEEKVENTSSATNIPSETKEESLLQF